MRIEILLQSVYLISANRDVLLQSDLLVRIEMYCYKVCI